MEGMERSCGAVIFKADGGSRTYVLIRQKNGMWGFPKGHREPGETEEETALREIGEEVGLRVRILPGFRRTEEYWIAKKPGVRKEVVYFCATYEEGEPVPDGVEVPEAVTVPLETALTMLSLESKRQILRDADAFIQEQEDRA